MSRLYQIQEAVRQRAEEIAAIHGNWPCRKGCDDCCRHLASVPKITREEWERIVAALDRLPAEAAAQALCRIRGCHSQPSICPLLDLDTGCCLVYEARPLACRAYGFYAERESVLGCHRIESIAAECPDVVWGNHATLEERLSSLGPSADLWEWLNREAG